ncbi:hypothetical protein ACWDSJ_24430 [Nocardia sp. NPDC003482]|uniref:hypothetical protein n=1 Tax=Nocardia sp. NPDC004068 TaxID=3364303 RepID=UPI00368257F6
MITPIEIRVDLEGGIADAIDRSTADRRVKRRDVWFAEARPRPTGGSPTLMSSGIVIRMRTGEHYDDVSVELRPCHPDQLSGRWAASFTEGDVRYRVSRRWHGETRAWSACLTSRRPSGSLRAAAGPDGDIATVLDSVQRQFLISCTVHGVAVEHLVALGPIGWTKWKRVRLGDQEVEAERWSVADLDLVELSLLVVPRPGETPADLDDRAAAAQRRLEARVRDGGSAIAAGETRTRLLGTLIARNRGDFRPDVGAQA